MLNSIFNGKLKSSSMALLSYLNLLLKWLHIVYYLIQHYCFASYLTETKDTIMVYPKRKVVCRDMIIVSRETI